MPPSPMLGEQRVAADVSPGGPRRARRLTRRRAGAGARGVVTPSKATRATRANPGSPVAHRQPAASVRACRLAYLCP